MEAFVDSKSKMPFLAGIRRDLLNVTVTHFSVEQRKNLSFKTIIPMV